MIWALLAWPIVGGTIDTGDPAVVAIVTRRTRCEETTAPIACSGTLIAPRVVLTAAHCIAPGAERGTLEVYAGARVGDPTGRFIAVDGAVRHPSFDDATHAFDIGLLHLVEPAQATPIAVSTATLEVGAPARVVGFGVTAVGMIADGQRRSATMTTSAVDGNTFTTTPAPGNSCGGDSGGPVFVTLGGVEQLVGVTVSGDPTCTTNAVNGRIDVAMAFITASLGDPAAPTVELGGACGAACATNDDCPAAFACRTGETGELRCQLARQPVGNLTEPCERDDQCSEGCARITADECRCYESCDAPSHTGSCAAGDPSPAVAIIALGLRRRRSARRTPAGSRA